MNERPLTKNEIFDLLKKVSIINLESEKIELLNAEGRILSCDIISSINLPPFNNSAVDGYAIHRDNLEKFDRLKLGIAINDLNMKPSEHYVLTPFPSNCHDKIEDVILKGVGALDFYFNNSITL